MVSSWFDAILRGCLQRMEAVRNNPSGSPADWGGNLDVANPEAAGASEGDGNPPAHSKRPYRAAPRRSAVPWGASSPPVSLLATGATIG